MESSGELYKILESRLGPKLIKPESLGVHPAWVCVSWPSDSNELSVVTTTALDQCSSGYVVLQPAASSGNLIDVHARPLAQTRWVRICFSQTSGDCTAPAGQVHLHLQVLPHGSSRWWWPTARLWFYVTVLGTWWVLALWKLLSFSPRRYSCIISSTIFSPLFSVSWLEIPISWRLDLLHGSDVLVVQWSWLFFVSVFYLLGDFLTSSIPSNAFKNFCYYIFFKNFQEL